MFLPEMLQNSPEMLRLCAAAFIDINVHTKARYQGGCDVCEDGAADRAAVRSVRKDQRTI